MLARPIKLPTAFGASAVAAVLLFWWIGSASAQPVAQGINPGKALTQLQLAHWTTTEGLPQGSALVLTQSKDGYLWIGTQEGLARFDGTRFRVFDKASGALPHNHVTALAEDAEGGLWIGTMGGGLVRYHRGRFEPFPLAERLPKSPVRALLADRWGGLWIGHTGGELWRFERGDLKIYGTADGLPGGDVTALYQDARGDLWVGLREGGLFRTSVGANPAFSPLPALQHTHVTAIEGEGDRLWIATRAHGLFEVGADPQRASFTTRAYTTANGLSSNSVLALGKDARGNLWIGLAGGGVARLHEGRFSSLSTKEGLAHDVVRALHVDREGNVWIGTDGGGIHRLRDGKFTPYTQREGLGAQVATAVFEDREGAIWIGTEGGGATRLHHGTIRTYSTADGLAGDVVFAFAETGDGSLWIGTYGGGLSRLQGGRFRTYGQRHGLPSDEIFGLYTDASGSLWIATGQGLAVFRNERFEVFTSQQGLSSNLVTALAEDAQGDLWVGTYDSGINVLREGRVFAQLDLSNGLRSNTVVSIYPDREHGVWVGTNEGGLHLIQDGRVSAFTTAEGLPSDKIFSILEDASGVLWMSSNRGLFTVPKRDLLALAADPSRRLHPTLYDQHDGLPSAEFTGGVQPSGWRGRDGKLWFPSAEGVASIDPLHIPTNRTAPPVVIEQMLVDGQLVPFGAEVALAPGSRKFEFDFVGLSLQAPERVTYRYMLEGVDADWVEAGTRREAFYTNLAPGRYTFRVRARNADGLWSPHEASVTFHLRPFFYQTSWFFALVLLALSGLLLGLYRLRVRHLRKRQIELVEEVQIRTRELREERDRVALAFREADFQRNAAEEAKQVIEEQADRLREMDRIKTRFFNNLSHEFRTPLTLNIGPLENALTGLYGPVSEEMRGQLSLMLRNARRLLRLINQLLDLAKLDAGKAALQVQHGDLVSFVEGVVLAFSAFAEHKKIRLDFHPEAATVLSGFDPQCVEKVMYNLLSNAVKFTPEGGSITVSLRPCALGSGKGVELRVEDTGAGIPADQLPYIFDRFHQVEGASSSVQEGTGIGLALVKDLVHLHGGEIEVSSTPGVGTAFRLTLRTDHAPLLDSSGDGHLGTPPSEVRGAAVETALFEEDAPVGETLGLPGQPVVLIADDNRDIRDFMVGCLRGRYTLLVATDGQDALEQARARTPDLVVSDVSMPRLDGYGLCRTLKADANLAHVPVILVTSKASSEERIEGLEAGADDYITKPFNARELLVRIQNLITLREHQRALKEANEALVEANELKSQLLHIAAHDLKAPLSGIRGCAEVLQEEIEPTSGSNELLNLIVSGVDRMVGLISHVLQAEALESGQLEFEMERLDLASLASSIVRANEPLAVAKRQQIVFSGWAGGDVHVSASEHWLRTALENLVSNGIKYSPFGGTISVTVTAEEQEAVFAVRDEGPGFAEHERPLLFKKFKRLSAQPTGTESSTGLGLSIAKHIVETHGGTISAESVPGEGSTFKVRLPLCNDALPVANVAW